MAIDISYIQYCEKLEKSIVENLHKTVLELYQKEIGNALIVKEQ